MLLMLGDSRICILAPPGRLPRRRRLQLLPPRPRIQQASAGPAAAREIQRRHDGSSQAAAGSGIGGKPTETAKKRSTGRPTDPPLRPRSSRGGGRVLDFPCFLDTPPGPDQETESGLARMDSSAHSRTRARGWMDLCRAGEEGFELEIGD